MVSKAFKIVRFGFAVLKDFYRIFLSKKEKEKEEVIEVTEVIPEEIAEGGKKPNTIVVVLAIIGAVAAVAGIAYAVYRYMTPKYPAELEDDLADDFEDDLPDDDLDEE